LKYVNVIDFVDFYLKAMWLHSSHIFHLQYQYSAKQILSSV